MCILYSGGLVMKKIRNLALAGCSLVLLTQCATQDELRSLQFQLRAMNQKLENVKSTTVNQMQRRQANSVTKLDQVENETLRLRSSLQENQGQTERFRSDVAQNIAGLQAAVEENRQMSAEQLAQLDKRVSVLEQKLDVAVDNFTSIQQQRVEDAQRRAREAKDRALQLQRQAKEKRQTVSSASIQSPGDGLPSGQLVRLAPRGKKARLATPSQVEEKAAMTTSERTSVEKVTSVSKEPPKTTGRVVEPVSQEKSVPAAQTDPFSKGMDAYTKKEYKNAYKFFEQSLAADPNGSKAGKTLFYMGESLFNQGEYDLAIDRKSVV